MTDRFAARRPYGCGPGQDKEAPRDALETKAHYVRQVKCTAAYRHANCKVTQWLDIQPIKGWNAAQFSLA